MTETAVRSATSVQPDWMRDLPLQQQSVLLLASRGPDGVDKFHPCKNLVRAYRASVFLAAKYGCELRHTRQPGDTFMDLSDFGNVRWQPVVDSFFDSIDLLPHHYLMHLLHGVEILGYKHPDAMFRSRWLGVYLRMCEDMHVNPESVGEMDARLSDWNREYWVY